ncbi:MAG: phosphoglycerate dehydrogenase, partial [Alphaproteobacteria bacterium]|nr:phosphoglycerate dehydrogenase [Alphaproteobacteria bacterium]
MLEGMSTFKVLVADLMALAPGADGLPDPAPFRDYIESVGACFHQGGCGDAGNIEPGRVHFFYRPELSREQDLLAEAADGRYDAVIAAATLIPAGARFGYGGVRIGAGTGNMQSESWGGRDGRGGTAALMNTPGINSRATAQMVMKALLRRRPDLPFETLHHLVMQGEFDTGRDLGAYCATTLEGQTMAVLGYGNIGREVARLAAAFGIKVRIHARPAHRSWIESEGFEFAASPMEAARGAD